MARILLPTATTVLLLLLLLLLSPAPISSSSATTTAIDTTVVDHFGNPVEAGSRYYIFYYGIGYFFGSLTEMYKPFYNNCPRYVGVSPYPTDLGPGVEFWPIDPTQKTITLSSDLNTAFAGLSNCSGKPVWNLTTNEANNGHHVTTDSVIEDETLRTSWFKIEKSDDSSSEFPYKPRFCPGTSTSSSSMGKGDDLVCGDLEISAEIMYTWLSLGVPSSDPFRAYFWPASIKPPVSISLARALA